MDLSFDQFVETISSLKTFERGGLEKRRATRVGHRARISIMIVNSAADPSPTGQPHLITQEVQLRDFSMRGLRFMQRTPMNKGDTFILLLHKRDGQAVHFLCKVAHCDPAGTGLFNIGARIERPIEKEMAQPGPIRAVKSAGQSKLA